MERMNINIDSVVQRNGMVIARARALVPSVGARIWIRLEFELSDREPWLEARDRVLSVLDPV